MRRKRRATRAQGPGERALWAALRRWQVRRPTMSDAAPQTPPVPPAPDSRRWWPRLTASQVQALLGAALTLALLLWDHLRQRLQQP
ncbi:MAG TPA: hypothetical protein VII06_10490 [Chloroflexota bacterium]